jgi:DNA-binding Lrp family transcriptional regulator
MWRKKEVPSAYVLLNTEIGAKNQVLKDLRQIHGVEEAYNLWGVYDIIANVKAESVNELTHIINKQIAKVGKIHSKLTMIISDEAQIFKSKIFVDPNAIYL